MKQCKKCNEPKLSSEFSPRKNVKDGLYSYCKKCVNENMRKSYEDNSDKYLKRHNEKREYLMSIVDDIKSKSKCKLCREDDPCCLDFHHLDPSAKDATITYLVGIKSEARMMKEIDKCVVVCSNCHRKLHAGKIKLPICIS